MRAGLESQQPAKAEADFKKAIAVAPQNSLGYTKLGMWRLMHKDFKGADALFEQALTHNPRDAQAVQGLVSSLQSQKKPDEAIARLTAQIAKTPDMSFYYQLMGALQAAQKDWSGAENSLRKAIAVDKNNITAYMSLGQLEAAHKSADQAAAVYQDAINANPGDARPYVQLALLQDARGNWQQAEQLYQKALQAQPDFPVAANNLAYLMLQRGGNVDIALSLAQSARRGMPDSPYTAGTLAWAYYLKGIYGLAVDLLQDATKQAPGNATLQYHLGLAYWKKNDVVHAREHLQKALAIDPNGADSAEVRKALFAVSKG